jgi:hypothetical protein
MERAYPARIGSLKLGPRATLAPWRASSGSSPPPTARRRSSPCGPSPERAARGRANEALALAIADLLGLRGSAVRLVSGERSRQKRFRIEASPEYVRAKLAEILAGDT